MKYTTELEKGKFYMGYRKRGTEAPIYDPAVILFKCNGMSIQGVFCIKMDIYRNTQYDPAPYERYNSSMSLMIYKDEWQTFELTETEVMKHIIADVL